MVRAQGLRYGLPQLDALHHTRLEDAIRDLMQRDGCQDAQRVGGRGDLGADVKAADPYGRRWVIQCKHRRNGAHGSPVGTPDLQVLNGFTAAPGSTDDARIRHLTLALPPQHAARLFNAQDAGASEQQLRELAGQALGEVYFRDGGRRAHGLDVVASCTSSSSVCW